MAAAPDPSAAADPACHVYCKACLEKKAGGAAANPATPQYCFQCKDQVSIVALDETLEPDLQQFFSSSLQQLESALQVLRFQNSNAVQMIKYLKERVSKCHGSTQKMAAELQQLPQLHQQIAKLQQENQLLQQENHKLRSFIGQGRQRYASSVYGETESPDFTQSSSDGVSPASDHMRQPTGPQPQRPPQPSRLSLPPGTPSSTASGDMGWRRSPGRPSPSMGGFPSPHSYSAAPAPSAGPRSFPSQTPRMPAPPRGSARPPGSAMPSLGDPHARAWPGATPQRGFATPQLGPGGQFAPYAYGSQGPGGYSATPRRGGGGRGGGPVRSTPRMAGGSAMPSFGGR
ncbi:hypothetical protein DFJ74DRAFT_751400 [Hyaloraphidium curvatum]|nr:hypothetical protein DFJ74DRAFT_751400 [Hyaloraphidium curvatum]